MAQQPPRHPGTDCSTAPTPGGTISVTSSPTRPTSSYTLDSIFADSAVEMEATTPAVLSNPSPKPGAIFLAPALPLTPLDVDQSLSDKMRQLAAVAWAMEQDDNMPAKRRQRLHSLLENLETHLESPSEEQIETAAGEEARVNRPQSGLSLDQDEDEDDDEWIDESELIAVRHSLADTVKSMRQRHEEQRHLHQLTVQKLEAVAQRCLAQEQQVQDLVQEMNRLRLENNTFNNENARLRDAVSYLEADASRNEVAVEAMSSAVSGLEGWLESAHPSMPQTPGPGNKKSKRQKVVIRGKGRFRGRYYVDEDGDEAVAYSLADAAADSQEIQEGVKAWLRGFRDVEEELRNHESPGRNRNQGRFRDLSRHGDEDWGDFQSPSSNI